MAIYRTSDSLSRCDPGLYDSIYDVRRRPDIKHEPIHATQPTHKDTIEISRDKLKEEALSRLRHTSKYVIAQNSFMRIGKYLFLAIAFPPYFMIYGLPKWILVEGVPAIFSMCVWMWKKVQQKSQKPLEAGTRKVVQMIQWMRNVVHVMIQPVVHLALEIRRKIQRLREQTLQFFKEMNEKVKKDIHQPRLRLAQGFKQIQNRLSHIRTQLTAQAHRLQEGIQWIKQSPQMVWGWGQMQMQNLKELATSWSIQWGKRFQTSQQLAQRATHWVSNQFKHRWDNLKGHFEPLAAFYRQYILPEWQALKEICKGKWQQTRHFFHQKHQRALAFLQNKQEKLKRLSYPYVLDRLLTHAWMKKLPMYFQQWLKQWLSHPIARAIGEKGVKIYCYMARGYLGIVASLLHALSYGAKWIRNTCDFIKTYAKLGKQKVLEIGNRSYNACRKFALYSLYYFLLGLTMAAILLIWTVQYLGHLMKSLTPSLSFVEKPN
jgi:hypothetical protein